MLLFKIKLENILLDRWLNSYFKAGEDSDQFYKIVSIELNEDLNSLDRIKYASIRL